jgi:hypothetical protein
LAALHHALGGEPLIARVCDVSASFACSGPAGDYRLELQLPRTGTWRLHWNFPGRPGQVFEVEGQAGWAIDASGARTPLSDGEVAMLRSHAFPWLVADLAVFFSSMEHAGTRLDSGRTLERLSMRDSAGQPAAAEIDLSTDLLLGLELSDTRSQPPGSRCGSRAGDVSKGSCGPSESSPSMRAARGRWTSIPFASNSARAESLSLPARRVRCRPRGLAAVVHAADSTFQSTAVPISTTVSRTAHSAEHRRRSC